MSGAIKPPSGYAVQRALAEWRDRIQVLLADVGPQDDEAELRTLLESGSEDIHAILEQVLLSIRHTDGLISLIDERLASLKDRRARLVQQGEARRTTALAIMDALERTSYPMAEFTASKRRGAQSVRVTDEAQIPSRFFRVVPETRTVDKATLRRAMVEDGEVIDGATLSNGVPYLAITTR